jgi:hypothetical protein
MSMDATGTLNKTLVFSTGGGVRIWCKPSNPKSEGQGDARQKFAAVQAAMKLAGAAVITAIKAVATVASQWNSYIVGKAIGTNAANFDAYSAAFTALTATPMGLWDTAFDAIIVPEVVYALMDKPSKGRAAFVVCSALYANGIVTSPGTPGAANAAAWETALTAAS